MRKEEMEMADHPGHFYRAAICWPRADEKGLFAYVVLRTESDYDESSTELVGVYATFPTAQQAVYDDAKPLGPYPTRVQQDVRGESEIEWGHIAYRITRQRVQGLGIVEADEATEPDRTLPSDKKEATA